MAGEKYAIVRILSGLKILPGLSVESSIFKPESTRTMAYFSISSALGKLPLNLGVLEVSQGLDSINFTHLESQKLCKVS